MRTGFDSRPGHVTNKHTRNDTVTRDASGDVVNMSGTITEAPGTRPYATRPETSPKHARD